ncbi:MAG: hypothetical protein NC245_01060 [Muribaculum sp.]|nr:hypothetical protein [Ruminococcus flavefaciens]MCM1373662.1 hypothetical protein [Muribaculum sp.]
MKVSAFMSLALEGREYRYVSNKSQVTKKAFGMAFGILFFEEGKPKYGNTVPE